MVSTSQDLIVSSHRWAVIICDALGDDDSGVSIAVSSAGVALAGSGKRE